MFFLTLYSMEECFLWLRFACEFSVPFALIHQRSAGEKKILSICMAIHIFPSGYNSSGHFKLFKYVTWSSLISILIWTHLTKRNLKSFVSVSAWGLNYVFQGLKHWSSHFLSIYRLKGSSRDCLPIALGFQELCLFLTHLGLQNNTM